MTSRKLTGRTQPRLWTPPLRPLTRTTSRGYELADFGDRTGEPFIPWQRWAGIHALELLPDNSYRFRVILILVGRQNGKSSLKRGKSLWSLYMDGARLVLGTAQDLGLAREQWNYALNTIHGCPELAAELTGERRVNGDEWFRVRGGGRYKISASNRKAGRGLSVDELTIDELREWRTWDPWSALSKTTSARANSQIWCMSNAGDDSSVVLNQLRDAALSGRDDSIGLFEWSAEDNCDLDDPRAWAQANPGLGYTVSEQAIATALTTDPPAVFRTEVLCQRVQQLDGAVDLAAWTDCTDASGSMSGLRERLAACIDIALDGKHVTLAVAAKLPDGRVRIEIAGDWKDTDTARAAIPHLLDRIKPVTTAWYPSGPVGALAPVLLARPRSLKLTGASACAACMGLADLIRARRVVHNGDPLLAAHLAASRKLHTGDAWRFGRDGDGHVDAAYAAAGAVHAALTEPPEARARIRVIQ